jgi:hypothetical protein
MTELDVLIWKKIEQIFVDDREIDFVTNEWIFHFTTEWDCCSESFISDIIWFDKIKWIEIEGVEKIEIEDDGRKRRQEEDEIYWYRIKTKDVICNITWLEISNNMIFAFRNSSNWRYGWYFVRNYTEYYEKLEKVKCSTEIFDNYFSN